MIVARSYTELKQKREALEGRIAFVPTMGALHEGHISLCRLAQAKGDHVVVSIFVNPTQFAPHEDLESYPRTIEADLEKLNEIGVSLVYIPSVSDIYPDDTASSIKAGIPAQGLETDFRPHFFNGVVNVVSRLFHQVRPDFAVFGEKDFQQMMVIRDMVETQNMDIEIIAAPTARDDLGLALSSRNAYLSEEELEIARMLNQIMYGVAHGILEGIDPAKACENAANMLLKCGFDDVDYVAYKPDWRRVLVAAWLGRTRLIDNCALPSNLPAL